jgi:two-component system, LuxR family, sensor kinase FixL
MVERHLNGPMALPWIFSLPNSVIGIIYLVLYVLLDWISYVDPFAEYGITPWNPPTGLSFVLVLLFGQRMIPFLFLAPFLADVSVRQLPLSWPMEFASVAVIGIGYSLGLLYLLRPSTRFNPSLPSLRDLLLLLLVAVASTALVAMNYVGLVIAGGLLPPPDFLSPFLRFWVGDLIGIAIIAPFTLIALSRGRLSKMSLETAAQIVAILVVLWLIFRFAQERQLQFLYILFLPIIWMAIRTGLEGVTGGILITQLGLIAGVHLLPTADVDITGLQAVMLVLAISGLMAGALVTEHRRTELQLRLHQESLAKLARLGSMGELAAAVAHEINQPLMAAGTYSRLVVDSLRQGVATDPAVLETAGKVEAQVERASEVVRRLRALVRLDQSGRAPVQLQRIVDETLALCRPDLDQRGIRVRVALDSNLPPVLVDLLQMEQVLLNLMRNAIDAMKEAGHKRGTIVIEARQIDGKSVQVSLTDTGPGFPPEFLGDNFPPLSSTKADGLGVGLALSRSIVEAHGGRLSAEGIAHGAVVRFTLPIASGDHA